MKKVIKKRNGKKFVFPVLCMMLFLTACKATDEKDKDLQENQAEVSQESREASGEEVKRIEVTGGKHHVEIVVKDYGKITVEIDADTAPVTAANFAELAQDGFYDGLTFHRIMDGFMMQGGDPTGTGMGGSEECIKGEFALNGVENTLSHTRGAISMARALDYDSASSQFFIVHQDSTFLDGQYACFGYVTEGMDVVDAVCKDAVVIDDNGTVPADKQPVIESVKVID